jgi:hypothetical protein
MWDPYFTVQNTLIGVEAKFHEPSADVGQKVIFTDFRLWALPYFS